MIIFNTMSIMTEKDYLGVVHLVYIHLASGVLQMSLLSR